MNGRWRTTKQAGVACGGCGKAGRCTVSPDGTAFKCWKDGGRVVQTGGRGAANGTGYVGKAHRPAAASGSRSYPSAEAAIAAAARSAGANKPTCVWTYHNADCSEAMRVARFDAADGRKQFRPIHPAADRWRIGDPPGPLPLYRRPDLPTGGTVFVCEGEKAADAACQLGLAATTSAHGSSSAARSDWSPLAGMDVVILPDHDAAGRHYADDVSGQLATLVPPPRVRVLQLPGLPDGGDVVEFIVARPGVEPAQVAAEIVALANAVTAAEDPGEAWPEPKPLPVGLPAVPAFDYALLPGSLRAWVADTAERMQCPPDYCAATAVVMAGMLIGRKVAVRPKRHDDWQAVANLYGMMVGRPSLMKTPAMQEMLKFVTRLECEAKAEHARQVAEQESAALVADATRQVKRAALKKAVQSGEDAQAIASELAAGEDHPPVRTRYLVNDTTVEKLGVILSENPNGVLIFADELAAFLRTMDRDGHEGDRGFYLAAWGGTSRYTYDRIGRGTLDVEAAIVSIVGSVQPGVIADYLRGAVHGGGGDDGLMQRFQLSVWPDPPGRWRNVDRYPDPAARAAAHAALRRLVELTPVTAGAQFDTYDRDALPFLRFDHNAQQRFDAWRAELEQHLHAAAEHPAVESHLAKYRSLVPSLALIFHLLDGGTSPIGEPAVERAVAWAAYLEAHARRLYAGVTEGPAMAAILLAKRILDGSVGLEFAARDVYRNGWAGLDRERIDSAVDVLVSLDWLAERVEPTAGRSRTRYTVNPRVLAGRAEPTEPTEDPFVGSVGDGSDEF